MHVGIDLGTSNSAIVGNLNSELRLFKTAEQADVLPSVIHIDKRGHRFVGRRAYDQAVLSPENVAQGFKRLMGTSSPITFAAAGIAMTPEDASAEIVRTLLTQAFTEAGKIEIDGAIVTIPAAFNQMQSEATIRAATTAGLDRVGLLQEPIAAAMASMSNSKSRSGQFLVYDLGGGTFDLALVQSVGGAVNVIAHEGINALGGRDFDLAIVNAVVRPWLHDQFELPENLQIVSRYKRLLGIARLRAEQAKIELSTKESAAIFVSDEEARAVDEAGSDIFIDVQLTRDHLEELVKSQLVETSQLCNRILKDNGYSAADIDRIVLIGGPTKMPCIRNIIPRELGIPVDLQTDPMTAVAVGAAIFAESREWGQGATKRKSNRATAVTSGPIDIRYDYTARTSDDRARIKIGLGTKLSDGHEIQVDSPDGWTSGRKALTPDATIEVPLVVRGDNRFRIMIFDPQGAHVSQSLSEIVITRTHASASGIPATQTIAAVVLEENGGNVRNALEPVIEKGTLLPAAGTKHFRAAHELKAGSNAYIDLELYQQEAGVPEPELNLRVGAFRISGNDLATGMMLRKHDEIIVRWSMDDSGLLSAGIEIPAVGQTFDTGRFYADTAGHQNFEGEDGSDLANAVLTDAENEVAEAEQALGAKVPDTLGELRRKLDHQRQTLEQADSADARRTVTDAARRIRQTVSRLRHAPENRSAVIQQQLEGLEDEFDRFVRPSAGQGVIEQFDRLMQTIGQSLQKGTPADIADAERALAEMKSVYGREIWQQPGFIIFAFRSLAEERYLAVDKSLHDRLVARGVACISNNDIQGLLQVVRDFYSNRFEVGGGDQAMARLAGLLRA